MKFAEQLELIKQYNDGLVTHLEFVRGMQLDATQQDALALLQAARVDISMKPVTMCNIMDDMVEKENAGLNAIPQLVYRNA